MTFVIAKKWNKKSKERDRKLNGIPKILVNGRVHQYLSSAYPTRGGQLTSRVIRQVEEDGRFAGDWRDSAPDHRGQDLVAPLYTAICEICGHAYSELMLRHAAGRKTVQCDECRQQDVALQAEKVQAEYGVDLGFHSSPAVRREHCIDRSDYHRMHVR